MSDIIKFKKEVLARLNQSIEYHPRKDHFSNPAANRDAYITKLKNRIESLSRNIMHSPVNRVPQTSSHSLKTSSRNSISEIRPNQIERRVNPFFKRSASPNPKTDSKAGNLGDEIKKISTSKCPNCSRDFEKDRLEKHQEICSKSKKKRPTFDAKKQRMREIPPVPKTKSAKPKRPNAEQKSSWRDRHREFQETLKHVKNVQAHVDNGGDARDIPAPPVLGTSSLIPCPHCQRKFSESAWDRHAPICQKLKSKMK